MGIPKQKEQYCESFSFRTNQTRQKALCPKSLASLLLSHQHQPESDPYTTVYRCVWSAVSTVK
jgi:hypothetical protein